MVNADRISELLGRLPESELSEPELSVTPAAIAQRRHRASWGEFWAREQYKRQAHNHRALVLGVGGSYSIEDWLALCKKAEWRCLRCRDGGKLEIDHVIPLEEGGANTIENIQPLCPRCNRWKGRESFDFRPLIQFIGLLAWRAL